MFRSAGSDDNTDTRPAVLAGHFYPADPGALTQMVDACLAGAERFHGHPKAIIAPHAGFIYSGPIAGTAYAALRSRRDEIRRVVLLGPCHRVAVRNFAVPTYTRFATPLGSVAVDQDAIAQILTMPGVEQRNDAHDPEHCLETQLPFLQRLLGDFTIVPILVGAAPRDKTAKLLEMLWGGPETLIVISSDLSHFHDYETARGLDTAACQAIETLAPDELGDEQACGRYAIKGLLAHGQALDLRATTLDLRNSGDTAGRDRRDSVVGYSAVAFEDAGNACLDNVSRDRLLQVAAHSIASGLRNGKEPQVKVESFPWPLRAVRASFVTLKMKDQLRGCVGSVKAHQPLVADVAGSAYRAAFGDRRFDALTKDELSTIEDGMALSISILSQPRRLPGQTEAEALEAMVPGTDGLILRDSDHASLLLPQVWSSIGDAKDFLHALKSKAGLPEDHWSSSLRLFRFQTETFGTQMKAEMAAPPSPA